MADEREQNVAVTEAPQSPYSYEAHQEHAIPTAPPTGLDIHPKPQGAVRVKKSIGVIVAIGGFVLVFDWSRALPARYRSNRRRETIPSDCSSTTLS